ncbi:hypothetical protein LCGC14_3084490, partial [marine sediment metagenome]
GPRLGLQAPASTGFITLSRSIKKSIQNAPELHGNLGKPVQGTATRKDPGIVHDDFDSKDVFAFGITLSSDLSEVDIEHRQVIRRSLDHDLLSRRFPALSMERTSFSSQDGLQSFDIESGACAVNEALKDLLQFGPPRKQKVTAVLTLVDGVGVPETGVLLVGQIQCKTQTSGVNLTITHLAQAPYSVLGTQGVCDMRQARNVGYRSETIPDFGKIVVGLFGLLGLAVLLMLGIRLYRRIRKKNPDA